MIVGRGMLANAFHKYKNHDNIIIFASGVSNSKETNKDNFKREKMLLIKTIENNQEKSLIYFSTCSIKDKSQKNSQYIIHKKSMEELIETKCKKYYIFRLPQVVGITNSPTLINFLINAIEKNNFFYVQRYATRNLIDVNDIVYLSNKFITEQKSINKIINIASPFNIGVLRIVNILEKLLAKKANFQFIEEGSKQNIDISKIQTISKDIFNSDYPEKILKKLILNKTYD